MNKILLIIIGLFFSMASWAENTYEPLLNKVVVQLSAERWLTTDTGLVTVKVNAAVNNQGIDQLQVDVMQKLNQLSNRGEWHVVSFDRQLDNSGLESIQITAQARLPQSELAPLRTKAKEISKPGVTFLIDNIQFTPSEDELRLANVALRSDLYQQAKSEINVLNKAYPEQKFYMHNIEFINPNTVTPMPMMQNEMMAKMSSSNAEPMHVGNKAMMQARVVISSMPDVVAKSLTASGT